MTQDSRNRLYIAGGPGGNSIGPRVHEYIAGSLGHNWTCEFLRLTSVEDVMKLFRARNFAGGIVTMPHKRTVIPFLDYHDDLVKIMGACNFVYLGENGQLNGTNTDWVGIHDAILAQQPSFAAGRIGMVYGAGGASRAAIYALWAKLRCSKVYIVNRDDQEVTDLFDDVHKQPDLYWPELVHLRSVSESREYPPPYYVVSTVPDFEPVTENEIEAKNVLVDLLARQKSMPKGIVLDMCYHPPMTRNLGLAQEHGYSIIQGFTVVASQFACQWNLWTGRTIETEEVFKMTERLVMEREHLAIAAKV